MQSYQKRAVEIDHIAIAVRDIDASLPNKLCLELTETAPYQDGAAEAAP